MLRIVACVKQDTPCFEGGEKGKRGGGRKGEKVPGEGEYIYSILFYFPVTPRLFGKPLDIVWRRPHPRPAPPPRPKKPRHDRGRGVGLRPSG